MIDLCYAFLIVWPRPERELGKPRIPEGFYTRDFSCGVEKAIFLARQDDQDRWRPGGWLQ